MENAKKGLFITFEGADGCGKTTQIELLNKYLQDKNCETIVTLEPGGSDIGKNLRLPSTVHQCRFNKAVIDFPDKANQQEDKRR